MSLYEWGLNLPGLYSEKSFYLLDLIVHEETGIRKCIFYTIILMIEPGSFCCIL